MLKSFKEILTSINAVVFCERSERELGDEAVSFHSFGTLITRARGFKLSVRKENFQSAFSDTLKKKFSIFTYELKWRYKLYQLVEVPFGQLYATVDLKQEKLKVWDQFCREKNFAVLFARKGAAK